MQALFTSQLIRYLLIINGMLFLVYIVEMTSLSTQGYEIQAKQQQLTKMREEYTQLRIDVVQKRSLQYIENRHTLQNMDSQSYRILRVQVTDTSYD